MPDANYHRLAGDSLLFPEFKNFAQLTIVRQFNGLVGAELRCVIFGKGRDHPSKPGGTRG